MIETINKLVRVQKHLIQDFGREPTSEEIARGSGGVTTAVPEPFV